jgi:hypothetical protein
VRQHFFPILNQMAEGNLISDFLRCWVVGPGTLPVHGGTLNGPLLVERRVIQ